MTKETASSKKKKIDNQIAPDLLQKQVLHQPDRSAAMLNKSQFDYDHEMVRGIFRFHECPGGSNSFYFRKYKEDQVQKYDMWDGQIYEIPRMVADHLNNNCKNVEYKYSKGDEMHAARPIEGSAGMYAEPGWEQKIGKYIDRMSFQITGPATGEYKDRQGMHGIAVPPGAEV